MFVSNIILFAYYTNNYEALVEWLERWHLSNGTWVRIPGPPKHLYYFVPGNPMHSFRRGPSCSSSHQTPSGLQIQSNGLGWTSTMVSGQQVHMESQKSNQAESYWAWRIARFTTNQAQHLLDLFLFLFYIFI